MSQQGNIRLKGACRVTDQGVIVAVDGRPANSGMFESVVRNGVGDYTYNVDPEWSYGPGDVIKVQCEGAVAACSGVERVSQTRFDVHTSEVGATPEALDVPHSVRVTTILRG